MIIEMKISTKMRCLRFIRKPQKEQGREKYFKITSLFEEF